MPRPPLTVNEILLARALEDTNTAHGSAYWGVYDTCPRKWQLQHKDKIVPLESLAQKRYFGVGQLVHAVLRYVGEAMLGGYAVDYAYVIDYAVANDIHDPGDAFEVSRLMPHYFSRWGAANASYGTATLESVETLLEWTYDDAAKPLLCPAVVSARADAFVTIGDERYIVDHKTTAQKLSDDFDMQCRHRPQFLRMLSLARKHGIAVDGIMVNSIVKTKEPKFDRRVIKIPNHYVDTWENNLIDTAHAMWHNETHVMNLGNCAPPGYAGGSTCEYRRYCHGTQEQRSELYGNG